MNDIANVDQPPAKRPFQFGLRSLFVVTAIVAVLLGLIAWLGYGGVLLSLLILMGISAFRRAWNVVALLMLVTMLWFCLVPPLEDARMAARRARRAQCMSNLRQLGLALHQYHEAYGSFPPAYIADENGRPMHSWRVLILPFLEQEDLYNRYRFDEPWDGPNNRKLAGEMPEVYRCPSQSARRNPGTTSYVAVVGPHTAWRGVQSTRFSDFIDGTATTILLIEMQNSGIHWMEPRDLAYPPPANVPLPSGHSGGGGVVFADNHYYFLEEGNPQLAPLLTIDGGETIDEADY